ncbi:MAG: hypothetical protein ACKOQM_15710 [Novosphingobium sp.]
MTIFRLRGIVAITSLVAGSLIGSATASAQATRTWISGVGDDANPCSRTAPCKTFAGAIPKTAAQGEINCIDPGGFGSVTITKAITLSCEGVTAGVLVAATNGINVNVAAGDVVRIRGLDIEGLGTAAGGSLSGINFVGGGTLYVSNTRIDGFGVGSGAGYGISFTPSSNATLVVDNVELTHNGGVSNPDESGGVLVQPPAGITATASITNSVVANGTNAGVRVETLAAGAVANVAISNTVLTNDSTGLLAHADPGLGTVSVLADNLTVSQNSATGVRGIGTGATIRIGNSAITGNGIGTKSASGATVSSYGNNKLNGNTSDGAFSGTIPQQ